MASIEDLYIVPNTPQGILYPSWVNENFREYKLDPIKIKEGIDPCNDALEASNSKTTKEIILRPYQKITAEILSLKSPYKSIALYHGVGSGKTMAALNIFNEYFTNSDKWVMIVLLKSSLIKTWEGEMNTLFKKDSSFKKKVENIHFISYNSSNANKKFKDLVRGIKIGSNVLYCIDEVHGFISRVLSNLQSQRQRNSLEIYEYIQRQLKTNKKSRVVVMSASMILNDPFEVGLLFNLLRPNSFP